MRALPIARWIQVFGVIAYLALFAAAQFQWVHSAIMLCVGSLAALAIVFGGAAEVIVAIRHGRRE